MPFSRSDFNPIFAPTDENELEWTGGGGVIFSISNSLTFKSLKTAAGLSLGRPYFRDSSVECRGNKLPIQ